MTTILAPAGAICFAVIAMAMQRVRPEVNWRSQGVSDYAAGPGWWVMALGFVALAAAFVGFAAGASGGQAWGAYLAAAGFLSVAIFPTGGAAFRGRAHTVGAFAGFLGAAIAAVYSGDWPGTAVVVSTAAFLASFRDLAGYSGALQRATFAAIVVWLVLG